MVGTATRRGRARWIEVSDFLRFKRVADVKDANAGVEVAASKGRGIFAIVNTAVVGTVGET